MDFKTSYANYNAGCASDEERRLVENELEKYTLIIEHFDAQWERSFSPISQPKTEIAHLNRRLRRQNALLVLTSIALMAALLIASVIGLTPSLRGTIQAWQGQTVDEKLAEQARLEAEAEAAFWNPTETRFCDYATDLELTIDAYTELFCPGYDVGAVWITKTGFASYQLNINRYNAQVDPASITGTLVEGKLLFDMDFQFSHPAVNVFYAFDEPDTIDFYLEKIQNLPEYVDIYAAVSFSDDLTIEELIKIKEDYALHIEWTAVDVGERTYGPCGMDIFSGGSLGYELTDSTYPDFSVMYQNGTPAQLENKFKTLLKYSADRIAEGKGIPVCGNINDFYTNALDYVEQNGIAIYGCYLITDSDTLSKLINNNVIDGIYIEDAWIKI